MYPWITVPCPQCGAEVRTLHQKTVVSIDNDDFSHGCGYQGKLHWVNPTMPDASLYLQMIEESRAVRTT